jgi:microcystin-dependent protein
MWSGSIDSIPSGWALCDGTNGTPDLRNRFVIAAGGNYDVGATGDGSIPSHTHAFSATTNSTGSHTHSHTLDSGYFGNASGIAIVGDKCVYNTTQYSLAAGAHAHNVSGTTSANGAGVQNIAVYYALAYIMKL